MHREANKHHVTCAHSSPTRCSRQRSLHYATAHHPAKTEPAHTQKIEGGNIPKRHSPNHRQAERQVARHIPVTLSSRESRSATTCTQSCRAPPRHRKKELTRPHHRRFHPPPQHLCLHPQLRHHPPARRPNSGERTERQSQGNTRTHAAGGKQQDSYHAGSQSKAARARPPPNKSQVCRGVRREQSRTGVAPAPSSRQRGLPTPGPSAVAENTEQRDCRAWS